MSVSSELEAKTEDNSVLLRPIPEIDVPDFGTLNRKQVTKDLKENDELNSKIYYQLVILQNCERNDNQNLSSVLFTVLNQSEFSIVDLHAQFCL